MRGTAAHWMFEGQRHCHLRQIPACQLRLWHVGLTSRHAKGTRIASLESSTRDSGPLDLPLGSAPHSRRWSHDYHPRLRRRRKRLDHRDGKPITAILSFSRHEFHRVHDVQSPTVAALITSLPPAPTAVPLRPSIRGRSSSNWIGAS